MKRMLIMATLLVLAVAAYAQEDVTKFLGIPVDGTKSAMIQKLKTKGFTYNSTYDNLEGEFNGVDVFVSVATNNNKVYRIFVMDANSSNETDIKIRFNKLCGQFERNPKYVGLSESQAISDDEDISYEMLAHSKRYEADYCQVDTAAVSAEMQRYFSSKYTQEQLENATTEMQMDAIAHYGELMEKKSVWFMIDEQYGKYRILMYYDNGWNKSDGEDL